MFKKASEWAALDENVRIVIFMERLDQSFVFLTEDLTSLPTAIEKLVTILQATGVRELTRQDSGKRTCYPATGTFFVSERGNLAGQGADSIEPVVYA